jgi:dephospho-CoA kinase
VLISKRFYLTGVAGTGKSTIAKALSDRGIAAFDICADPRLCYWRDRFTKTPVETERGVGKVWLEKNEHVCSVTKLKQLFHSHSGTIVVAGYASNQGEYLALFDKVLFLHCSAKTLLHRLQSRTNSTFAKTAEEQAAVAAQSERAIPKLLAQGAIPISSEGSIAEVVERVASELY